MKSTGDRLGRPEKAQPRGAGGRGEGDLWDWIESKMIDTYLFYIGGCRIANRQQST